MFEETGFCQFLVGDLHPFAVLLQVLVLAHPFGGGNQQGGAHHAEQVAHHFRAFSHKSAFLSSVLLQFQRADVFQLGLANHRT